MIVHVRTCKKNTFHANFFFTPLHPPQPEAPEHPKITVSRCFSSKIFVSREFFYWYVKNILNNDFLCKNNFHPLISPYPEPPEHLKITDFHCLSPFGFFVWSHLLDLARKSRFQWKFFSISPLSLPIMVNIVIFGKIWVQKRMQWSI